VADWIWIPAFIVAISVLVAVHEFGHYWVARRLGFKVLRFSIGFGKPLWKRVWGPDRTEYVIAAIPLGGYVKLLDEREGPVPDRDLPRSFMRRPIGHRLLVLGAGPVFNFLFAILAYWFIFMWGVPQVRAIVGDVTIGSHAANAGLRAGDEIVGVGGKRTHDSKSAVFALLADVLDDGRSTLKVRSDRGAERLVTLHVDSAEERHRLTEPGLLLEGLGFEFDYGPATPVLQAPASGSPAERAGLEAGDKVLAVDGRVPRNTTEFVDYIKARPGQRVTLTVDRDGTQLRVPVDVGSAEEGGRTIGRIGVGLGDMRTPRLDRFGPVSALGRAAAETWEMSHLTVNMLWNMVLGRVSVKNISGPINIAAFAGETARSGVRPYLMFLAIVSISLGILNLLPIPILDGGQMLFQAIEFLKGSPLSERAQLLGQQVGIALLLLLMSLAFYNDISSRFLN
jgi:regulator of sigma E protease